MTIFLSIFCLLTMAAAAYVIADARGEKGWQAAVATALVAPLFFVLLFKKPEFSTGEEDSTLVRTMKVLGTAAFAVMIGIVLLARLLTGSFGALPSCDSSYTVELAQQAVADSPMGINFGVRLVALQGVAETGSSSTMRSCSAIAMTNSGARVGADYTLSLIGSQLYIEIQFVE